MTATATERVLLDEESLQRTLRRIAHEIVEKHPDLTALGLVGIYTRGATLAQRLRDLIEEYTGARVPTGALDITFYRDDVTLRAEQRAHPQPVVKATRLDFPLEGKSVVVVDDLSTPAARSGRRSRPSSTTDAPSACSSPSSSTAAIASFRSGRTTSARTFPPPARSG